MFALKTTNCWNIFWHRVTKFHYLDTQFVSSCSLFPRKMINIFRSSDFIRPVGLIYDPLRPKLTKPIEKLFEPKYIISYFIITYYSICNVSSLTHPLSLFYIVSGLNFIVSGFDLYNFLHIKKIIIDQNTVFGIGRWATF